jgi:hypothetical protein
MKDRTGSCPLGTGRIVEEYFVENRHRLLDIAAFLDRLDRSRDGQDPGDDFRVAAFRKALRVLADPEPGRVRRIQMILSDPTVEPRGSSDRKAAWGAYDPGLEVS